MPDLGKEFESETDLGKEFAAEEDLGSAFAAEQPAAQQHPQPAPRPQVGKAEALGRGAAQGASLLLGDEASGGIQANISVLERALDAVRGVKSFPPLQEVPKFWLDEYRKYRDAERRENDAAAEDHPVIYGGARVVGGLPAAIASGGQGAIALGAGTGLAGSDAELTPDKVSARSAGEAALSTALGAGTGAFAKYAPTAAKFVLPVAGLGLAAEGDKIGMSKADRVSAGVGAGLGLASLAAEGLEQTAGKLGAKAGAQRQKAFGQLKDELSEQDYLDDWSDAKAANKQVDQLMRNDRVAREQAVADARANEDSDFKAANAKWKDDQASARAAQRESARQSRVDELKSEKAGKLSQLEAEDRFREASSKVQQHEQDTKTANREYLERLKKMADELKATEKVRNQRSTQQEKLQSEVASADEALDQLPDRVKAHRASAFKEAATRMQQFEDLTGKPLPEKYAPVRQKIANSYERNSDSVIIDPDESAEYFQAREKPSLDQAKQQALARLKSFQETPFDEKAAVAELLKPKASVVPKQDAYELAKNLGLEPGDFERFDPLGARENPMPLARPAPQAPAPLPDRRAASLASYDKRIAKLEAPKPTAPEPPKPVVTRRPEAEILKDAGLDQPKKYSDLITLTAKSEGRAPVDQRAQEIVQRAGGPLGGAGAVLKAGMSIPLRPLKGALKLTSGDVMRVMGEVDPRTGKMADPEGVAAAMGALERTLKAVPELGEKYLGAFRKGLSPAQVMFYVQRDPKLRQALDEQGGALVQSRE